MIYIDKILILSLFFVELVLSCEQKSANKETKRIVKGGDANFDDVRFAIQIEKKTNAGWRIWCGGTIVSKYIAVTATNCFQDSRRNSTESTGEFRVRSGSANIGNGGVMHTIVNKANSKGLLAVIEVRPAFQEKPIRSFSDKTPADDEEVVVYGWGSTGSNVATKLQQADVKVMSREECKQLYDRAAIAAPLNKNVFCSHYYGPDGTTTCNYDDGGPVLAHGKLTGVMLYAGLCARGGLPALYVNVVEFKPWIEKHLKPCKPWDNY